MRKIAERIELVIRILDIKKQAKVASKLRTALRLLEANRLLKANQQRRFLNFTPTKGIETDSYMTQPGYGHDLPSGQVYLDNTTQDGDIVNTVPNIPLEEKPTSSPGPRGDKEQRRMPVQTVDNFIPPRVVPR